MDRGKLPTPDDENLREQVELARGTDTPLGHAIAELDAAAARVRALVDGRQDAAAAHRFAGTCPDDTQPGSRDPQCPACQQLPMPSGA